MPWWILFSTTSSSHSQHRLWCSHLSQSHPEWSHTALGAPHPFAVPQLLMVPLSRLGEKVLQHLLCRAWTFCLVQVFQFWEMSTERQQKLFLVIFLSEKWLVKDLKACQVRERGEALRRSWENFLSSSSPQKSPCSHLWVNWRQLTSSVFSSPKIVALGTQKNSQI